MERLTYRGERDWEVKGAGGTPCDEVCENRFLSGCHDCPIQTAFDRLAAYEDAMPIERAQELAKAEKEGRLIAYLPGEKVYDRFGTPWIIESSEIHLIQGKLKQLFRCGRPGAEDYYAMYEDEILTREEAETALKKREGENPE